MTLGDYTQGLWSVRFCFQRGLAAIYLIAFVVALNQFPALLGERGLLPAARFLKRAGFQSTPSLFHWRFSDPVVRGTAWLGIVLSLLALFGVSESGPVVVSVATWLALWFLYLSFVNAGQIFYSFGWESMLLEAGFLGAFLGPSWSPPSIIPILALRWMLFRTEVGAGLIKLRHDPCWRDLTCMYYHHETQPLPNGLSRHFHHLPKFVHRLSVVFSHFVQIVAPFGLFAPQPIAAAAGGLLILQQLILMVSGNYAWLNWLTVLLGVTALSDRVLPTIVGAADVLPRSPFHEGLLCALATAVALMSIRPAMNLVSKNQRMNENYNPLHLIGSYGAFGSITKERYEIVIEGTDEERLTPQTCWREYEFKAKPGAVARRPPQIAPYHLRLDWLMWFLPFSAMVTPRGVLVPGYEPWFIRFVEKLLAGDPATLRLLRRNPFSERPPRYIRAGFYLYRLTTREEKRRTGAYWRRTRVGDYLPPVTASHAAAEEPVLVTV
jgi:Lipase maturation factor